MGGGTAASGRCGRSRDDAGADNRACASGTWRPKAADRQARSDL